MKHSKGPWTRKQGTLIESAERPIALLHIKQTPAESDEEAIANANLILAAPEMFEALEALQRGFMDGSICFTKKRRADSDPYHPANTLMNAALDKARGED